MSGGSSQREGDDSMSRSLAGYAGLFLFLPIVRYNGANREGNYSMDAELKTILTQLRRSLKKVYGSRLVDLILYGSQARGDAYFGSDIDVLVVLTGPVDPITEVHRTSEIVAGLSLEYDQVISCVFIEQEALIQEDSFFMANVRREGIPV